MKNDCRNCQYYSTDDSVGYSECTYDMTNEELQMYWTDESADCIYYKEYDYDNVWEFNYRGDWRF